MNNIKPNRYVMYAYVSLFIGAIFLFDASLFAMQKLTRFKGTIKEHNDRFENERIEAAATFISDFNARNVNTGLTLLGVKTQMTHDANYNIREILLANVTLHGVGELANTFTPIQMTMPIPFADPHKGEIARFDSNGNSI